MVPGLVYLNPTLSSQPLDDVNFMMKVFLFRFSGLDWSGFRTDPVTRTLLFYRKELTNRIFAMTWDTNGLEKLDFRPRIKQGRKIDQDGARHDGMCLSIIVDGFSIVSRLLAWLQKLYGHMSSIARFCTQISAICGHLWILIQTCGPWRKSPTTRITVKLHLELAFTFRFSFVKIHGCISDSDWVS